jgi:hypothetical protein
MSQNSTTFSLSSQVPTTRIVWDTFRPASSQSSPAPKSNPNHTGSQFETIVTEHSILAHAAIEIVKVVAVSRGWKPKI